MSGPNLAETPQISVLPMTWDLITYVRSKVFYEIVVCDIHHVGKISTKAMGFFRENKEIESFVVIDKRIHNFKGMR
jgi:hypothetical protein